MKIAVATDSGNVSAHFGHCSGFAIYDIENDKITAKNFVPNPGHKPGFLPVFLSDLKVNLIIAGGMGGHAQELFAQNSIDVIVGAVGSNDEAIDSYLSGELKSTGVSCSEHANSDSCGGH